LVFGCAAWRRVHRAKTKNTAAHVGGVAIQYPHGLEIQSRPIAGWGGSPRREFLELGILCRTAQCAKARGELGKICGPEFAWFFERITWRRDIRRGKRRNYLLAGHGRGLGKKEGKRHWFVCDFSILRWFITWNRKRPSRYEQRVPRSL